MEIHGAIENPSLRIRDASVACGVVALVLGGIGLLAHGLRSEMLAFWLWRGLLLLGIASAALGVAWLVSRCPKCGQRLLGRSLGVVSPFGTRCPHCRVVFYRGHRPH